MGKTVLAASFLPGILFQNESASALLNLLAVACAVAYTSIDSQLKNAAATALAAKRLIESSKRWSIVNGQSLRWTGSGSRE